MAEQKVFTPDTEEDIKSGAESKSDAGILDLSLKRDTNLLRKESRFTQSHNASELKKVKAQTTVLAKQASLLKTEATNTKSQVRALDKKQNQVSGSKNTLRKERKADIARSDSLNQQMYKGLAARVTSLEKETKVNARNSGVSKDQTSSKLSTRVTSLERQTKLNAQNTVPNRDQTSYKLANKVTSLEKTVSGLQRLVSKLQKDLCTFNASTRNLFSRDTKSAQRHYATRKEFLTNDACLGYAITGNVYLNNGPFDDLTVSGLNNSTVSGYQVEVNVSLDADENKDSGLDPDWATHTIWPNGLQPFITTNTDTVVDGDISAPVVEYKADPSLAPRFNDQGVMSLLVTLDTDAGATKTYQDGENLQLTISVSGHEEPLNLSSVADLIIDLPVTT